MTAQRNVAYGIDLNISNGSRNINHMATCMVMIISQCNGGNMWRSIGINSVTAYHRMAMTRGETCGAVARR